MKTQESKIAIPCCKSYAFVSVKDIVRCEGLQNYTKIYLITGEMLVSTINIGVYIQNLEPYGFFTPHKSHLINEGYIETYHKDGRIELTDKSTIPVSRRRKENLMRLIKEKYELDSFERNNKPNMGISDHLSIKMKKLKGGG